MSYFVVVFSADKVIQHYPNKRLIGRTFVTPPGEYVVVCCKIGDVGGGRIGITLVETRKVDVTKEIDLQIWSSDSTCMLMNCEVTPVSASELTTRQREGFITAIKESEYHWWWDHAPREVKSIFQGALTKEDEARELLCQGVELTHNNKYEAKQLIEKALSLYPHLGSARFQLGVIEIELGHIKEAINFFEDELKSSSEPLEDITRCYLTIIYQAMGDIEKAETHAQARMATETYRRSPTSLAPEVVQQIQRLVQLTTASAKRGR